MPQVTQRLKHNLLNIKVHMKNVGVLKPIKNRSTENIKNPFTNGVANPVINIFTVAILIVHTRP